MKNHYSKVGVIALSLFKGIGPSFIKKTVTAESFLSDCIFDQIKEIFTVNKKNFEENLIQKNINIAAEIVSQCESDNISIVEISSKNYPSNLKQLKTPPPVLYCRGNLDLLYQKTVCIIGTREPNNTGAIIAERIGSYFSGAGWAICNGLAEGIDYCAIRSNGKLHRKLVGVVAGGLNFNSSRTLLAGTAETAFQAIENGGLIVSEKEPSFKEDTFSIISSCRIQAGLSHGLILVQSSLSGGSRFTIKSFCETQRPLAVVHPVKADYFLLAYEANRELIENQKLGLVKFTELKEEKIETSSLFVIRSKDDYQVFEDIVRSDARQDEQLHQVLFE
jgi:DNA processing protein